MEDTSAMEQDIAMCSHPWRVLILIGLCGLCSCKTQRTKTTPEPMQATTASKTNSDLNRRNNALALLDDLLGDEKNLSKILIIKHNSDELGTLVKNISKTSGEGAKMLEAWAKAEPGLDLKRVDLPPGEVAARKEIAKTKEHILLHDKDAEFQFQLLLTQIEGLNYGAYLALVAADNEPNVERARQLLELSKQLRDLREQVVAMVRAGGNAAAK